MRNPIVAARVPEQLRDQLRERAEAEDRPEGQVVRHALIAYLADGPALARADTREAVAA